MKIDIISDTICPWCYIGKRRLEMALAQRPHMEFDVRWRPFRLDPTVPLEGVDRKTYLKEKFGEGERPRQVSNALHEFGAAVGINFAFDKIALTPNTLDSHRLLRWAGSAGVQHTMAEILFRRYFIDGEDIGDPTILVMAAGEAGMDQVLVAELLAGDADRQLVHREDMLARRMGVQGVPAYVIDDKYLMIGAQEPDMLLSAIDKAVSEAAADARV
ncbi:MAG: disulfide bond formation protein DsbA [Alphaproteobacteria bacterium]|nr:disulfide bond formation protein DsbA [Alphaproteobacteria bacterium]